MRMTAVCVPLILSGLALAADHPEIPLWANGAPGSEGKTAKEVDKPPNEDHGYFKVTRDNPPPTRVVSPPGRGARGPGEGIAPGGAPPFPNLEKEGPNGGE